MVRRRGVVRRGAAVNRGVVRREVITWWSKRIWSKRNVVKTDMVKRNVVHRRKGAVSGVVERDAVKGWSDDGAVKGPKRRSDGMRPTVKQQHAGHARSGRQEEGEKRESSRGGGQKVVKPRKRPNNDGDQRKKMVKHGRPGHDAGLEELLAQKREEVVK